MTTQNEVKPLTDHASNIKPKVKAAEEAFQNDIGGGGNFNELLITYNKKIQDIKNDFISTRKTEYLAVREIEQKPSFQAEEQPVYQWEPRQTQRRSATYNAPEGMKFDTININPKTAIGNTNKSFSTDSTGRVVTVSIRARSRYATEGKSHIIVEPIVTWRFGAASAENRAKEDWEGLNELLNQ